LIEKTIFWIKCDRTENPNTELRYEYDLQNRKTSLFSNMVINNRTTYTLGNMCHILQSLSDEYLLDRSELMKDFSNFINENYSLDIFTKSFVSDLMELSKRYRNKSAHVSVFPRDKVGDCKFLVRKILNNFLESV
jgi:type III restriction enzyme